VHQNEGEAAPAGAWGTAAPPRLGAKGRAPARECAFV
jgi:hypothetical protein